MADELILLVERDAKTRRLLKVSLEQVGYAVESARDGVGALELLEVVSPALIIAATDLPKLDGYGLVRELKKHEEWSAIPLIFVVEAGSIESKIRGLELGVDEYIQKPIFVKELHSRVQVCLAKKVRHRLSTSVKETRVRGSLQDLPPVDLLETLETGRQSATLRMSSGGRLATVYIQEGEIIDAQLKRLRGEEVIYRVLTWSDGTYEVEVGDVDREPVVEASTRSLMEAGMRHAAEFQMLAADLPRSGVVLQPNRREVHERGGDIPEEIMAIVDLFDGRRTLLDVIDESPFDDLSTLSTVAKLLEEELLAVVAPGPTALDRTATPLHPSSDAASLTTGEDVDDTALTMRPPSVKAGRAAAQIDAGSIGQAAARAVAEPFVADTLASDRVGEIDEDETADGDEESVDDEDADRLAGLAGDRVDDGFDDDAFDASFLADPENGGRNAVGPPEGQAPPKTPPRGGSKHVRVSAMADERLADDERPTVALGDELAEFAPAGRITPAEGSGIFSAASLLDGEADDPPTVPFTRDKLVAPGRGRSTGARAGSHEGRGDDEEDASFKGSGEYDDDASFEGSGEYDDEASFEGSGEYDDDASFEGSGEYDDEASFEGSGEYDDEASFEGSGNYDDDESYEESGNYDDDPSFEDDAFDEAHDSEAGAARVTMQSTPEEAEEDEDEELPDSIADLASVGAMVEATLGGTSTGERDSDSFPPPSSDPISADWIPTRRTPDNVVYGAMAFGGIVLGGLLWWGWISVTRREPPLPERVASSGPSAAVVVTTAAPAPKPSAAASSQGSPAPPPPELVEELPDVADPLAEAKMLFDRSKFADAIPMAKAAAKKDPDNGDAYFYLGYALAMTGDKEHAKEAFQKCVDAENGTQRRWCTQYAKVPP